MLKVVGPLGCFLFLAFLNLAHAEPPIGESVEPSQQTSISTKEDRLLLGGGGCPAPGSCFTPHDTPGCSDETCCNAVCSVDDDCCRFEWDNLCVNRANTTCTSTCPAAGSCFAQHGTPGCDDADCCNAVCAKEPLCCELDWDGTCVGLANGLCTSGPCPATGSCFLPHATPGCDDASCCQAVCEADAECCTNPWDSICVQRARERCGCAGEGNCFVAKQTPSCDNDACCGVVCAQDPACCELEWDCRCAELAQGLCSPATCPATGNCFAAHGTPGCSDDACCSSVCLLDAECCSVEWDNLCVNRALDVCPTCPGTGSCLVAHGTRGCDNAECCSSVCEADPWCCSVEWDRLCAASAEQRCAIPTCPGSGSCFSSHAGSGCNNEACCTAVCLGDPKCCTGPWDSVCVDRAREVCSRCPGEGRCDVPHVAPGCEDSSCCNGVCKIWPPCCSEGWDLECVEIARQECGSPACPGEGSCFEVHSPSQGCENVECCNAVCLQDPNCCGLDGWDSLCVDRANVVCRIPSNDQADGAISIECGEVHLGSTIGATGDAGVFPCGPTIGAPGVWYRVTGTGHPMTVETCDPRMTYDTRVAVYTGECGRALNCIVGNDDACSVQSSVTWDSLLGERYWVLVHGTASQTGDFALGLLCQSGCPVGPITWIDPPDGVVDARQPHSLGEGYPRQGVSTVVVQAPSGATKNCWSLCETLTGPEHNSIAQVNEAAGVYTLTLTLPLVAGEVTTINYGGFGGSATGRFTTHPGNVDGIGNVDRSDVYNLISCLNGIDPGKTCPWGFPYSQDIDHSGRLTPADLMRVMDLMNGAEIFDSWNGTPPPTNTVCP